MKLYIASDHGGWELKQQIVGAGVLGAEIVDLGPVALNVEDDYPEFAFKLGEQVAADAVQGQQSLGVLICRSGNGMAIAANKVKGVRAAVCFSKQHAVKARQHNHANVLALDADYDLGDTPQEILTAFLEAVPEGERHQRRVEQISAYENSH